MARHILGSKLNAWSAIVTLLVIPAITIGCGNGQRQGQADTAPDAMQDSVGVETYAVTGRVMSITPDRDFLMVRHDEIPGFMEAMTMPFAVRDTALVRGIAAGDSISFQIEYYRGEVEITAIDRRP